jgi:hypothetical protein
MKVKEGTCTEPAMAIMTADQCAALDGKFAESACPTEKVLGVCTRYGKGPLASTVMLR